MRNFLFIFGLLVSCLLFAPEIGTGKAAREGIAQPTSESVMKEKGSADAQRHFEALSNELKESSCLTPRRAFQSSGNSLDLREWKSFEKILKDLRLRGENELLKVSQQISTTQTIRLSALVFRTGEHLHALRRLII